jgi:hypothetical protein
VDHLGNAHVDVSLDKKLIGRQEEICSKINQFTEYFKQLNTYKAELEKEMG